MPTANKKVLPARMPRNSFVIGVLNISVAIRNVRYIATPPKSAVELLCHLSSLGLAILPYLSAALLVSQVRDNDRIKEKIKGAI
jgi:type III secretory pathway component EscT